MLRNEAAGRRTSATPHPLQKPIKQSEKQSNQGQGGGDSASELASVSEKTGVDIQKKSVYASYTYERLHY